MDNRQHVPLWFLASTKKKRDLLFKMSFRNFEIHHRDYLESKIDTPIGRMETSFETELHIEQKEIKEFIRVYKTVLSRKGIARNQNGANLSKKPELRDYEFRLARAMIKSLIPGDSSEEAWGDIIEIISAKQRSGCSPTKIRLWLWLQVVRGTWPTVKWQARRLCSGFLKLVGLSQAIEWLFSKF